MAQGHVEWLNLDPVPIKIKASFDFNGIGRDLSETAGSVWQIATITSRDTFVRLQMSSVLCSERFESILLTKCNDLTQMN